MKGEKSPWREEKKKCRNGRAHKIHGHQQGYDPPGKYALRGSVEKCNAYLEGYRNMSNVVRSF